MKDISCKVIEDLIPLVEDGIASDESTKLVREHMENCELCKGKFGDVQRPVDEVNSDLEDKRIIKDIKRKVLKSQIIILVVGSILGVTLTNTMGMFYNIALIPLLGGLSYIALKNKWYIGPLGIMVLTYLWQIGESIVLKYFGPGMLYGAFMMPLIYGGLAVLGVLIGFLLKFSFGKEDVRYEK